MRSDLLLRSSFVSNLQLLEQIIRGGQPALADGLRLLVQELPALLENVSPPSAHSNYMEIAIVLVRSLRNEAGMVLPSEVVTEVDSVLRSLEEALSIQLRRPLAKKLKGLYVIVDPQACQGRPVVEVARAALRGGAAVIQLRDKLSDVGALLPTAMELRELCEEYDALLIINDYADLARICSAHGFHGGQSDLPTSDVRNILSPYQLVGRSNTLLEEFLESQQQGADYLAVGDMFGSPTKKDTRPAGLSVLREVVAKSIVPVAAIGGINESNVTQIVNAGADMVCVISAVVGVEDPENAARRLVELMDGARR